MSIDNIYPIEAGQSEGNAPKLYSITCSNTKLEVSASGFFNSLTYLKVSDLLIVRCTDGLAFLNVSSLSPTTVTNIDTGGSMIIQNGVQKTESGTTQQTITGPFLATDIVHASERSVGTNQAEILESYSSDGSITVAYKTDPGDDAYYNLTVIRS